ncbi:hypothetical protein PAENIP36_04920 [Paenibacillus sp. P36]
MLHKVQRGQLKRRKKLRKHVSNAPKVCVNVVKQAKIHRKSQKPFAASCNAEKQR